MAEILFNKTITLTDGGPPVVEDVNVAQNIEGAWSLIAQPVDSGPANPTNLELARLFMDKAEQLVAPGALTDNVLNTFDQTVVFTRLRVTLTPGATAPDGGVRLQLVGTRR